MSIGIYKITNKINNKCYIGQSVNLENRIRSHKSMLKHHNEDNDLLNKATQKYGYENFEIEIIKYCKENELDFYEKYYINFYNSYKRQNYLLCAFGRAHLEKRNLFFFYAKM